MQLTHEDKWQESKNQSALHAEAQKKRSGASTFQLVDNRPEAVVQRKLQAMVDSSPQVHQAAQLQAMANNYVAQRQPVMQKQANHTGLPDTLKTGIEHLSGMSLDDVKVHRNSAKPAQLQAHAYAQGTEIHLGPGQEKHLPHEAWHVVQQKQGRVKPTVQMKGKININDDAGLEKEADVMGKKAVATAIPWTRMSKMPTKLGTSGSIKVAQNLFTAKGEKNHKIRQWRWLTKRALEAKREHILLDLFKTLDKSKKAVAWDIREPFGATRYGLRKLLEDDEKAPIPTLVDEDRPVEALRGSRSATGYRRLAAWDLKKLDEKNRVDEKKHTDLAHVSTQGDWMTKRVDTLHGSNVGELGPGFYTVGGHGDVGTKSIRDEFGSTGKVPRDVLRFRIANAELGQLVDNDDGLANFLIYVLQHRDGYPKGSNPVQSIDTINKMGHVLIFPDKTTKVNIDSKGTQHSYESYRKANGPSNHHLIIGPQARSSLDGIRQICARGYLGDKIINEAQRYISKLGPKRT